MLADSNGYQYVRGNGLISQITNLNTRRHPLVDGLCSIRVLTDSNGRSIGTQTYDACGSVRTSNGVNTLHFDFARACDVPPYGSIVRGWSGRSH